MTFTVREMLLFASALSLPALPAQAQEPPMIAFSPMNIEFMSGPIAFDNEPVTGAPYAAEAITEVVQTLSDGNRIVRESKVQIARDGKGRTRREEGLAMFGPLVGGPAGADQPRHVQISDPGTKTTILLDLQHRMAHKIPAPYLKIGLAKRAMFKAAGKSGDADHFEMALPAPHDGPEGTVHLFSGRKILAGQAAAEPLVEGLGTQFMEGLTYARRARSRAGTDAPTCRKCVLPSASRATARRNL